MFFKPETIPTAISLLHKGNGIPITGHVEVYIFTAMALGTGSMAKPMLSHLYP